jgi:hypothetical protein
MCFPAQTVAAAFALCVACALSPAEAQVTQAPTQSAAPPPATSTPPSAVPLFVGTSTLIPGWTLSFSPYAWVPSVSARINAPTPGGGVATTDVFVPFSDYVHDIRFGTVLAGQARYDRFSLLTDFLYLNLGMSLGAAHLSSVSVGPSGRIDIPVQTQASASVGMGTTLWTLAGGYTLAASDWGNVDAIVGARLLNIDVTNNYTLNSTILLPNRSIALARSGSLGVSVANWDAIGGVTGRIAIPNSGFYVPFYFDAGTGDIHLTWQAFAGVGYRTSWADISIGYRYLAFDNKEGAPVQSLAMGGVMAAATFRF